MTERAYIRNNSETGLDELQYLSLGEQNRATRLREPDRRSFRERFKNPETFDNYRQRDLANPNRRLRYAYTCGEIKLETIGRDKELLALIAQYRS